MKKFMQYAPSWVVVIVLGLQIPRVASFAAHVGAPLLFAAIFALVVSGGIFVAAYWRSTNDYIVTASPEDKRAFAAQKRQEAEHAKGKQLATTLLVILIVADGIFNLADVFTNPKAKADLFTGFAAAVYGALPTIISWLFGEMQGKVKINSLPDNGRDYIGDFFTALVNRISAPDNQPAAPVTPKLTDDSLIDYVVSNPGKSLRAIGAHFGVTGQAIDSRVKKLVNLGRLDKGVDGKLTARIPAPFGMSEKARK